MRKLLALAALFALSTSSSFAAVQEVVILGINDLHGNVMPIKEKTTEDKGVTPIDYTVAGGAMLASHVKALREEYGSKLLVVDAGDQWQGTFESNTEGGAAVVALYNAISLSAATIGNHEFDFGAGPGAADTSDKLGNLKKQLAAAQYPYVSGNIVDQRTGKYLELPNTRRKLLLDAGGVRVGVIGLTTETTPVTTLKANIKDLRFTSLLTETLALSSELRESGAQVIVLLAHAGMRCQAAPGKKLEEYNTYRAQDVQGACDNDEMSTLLRALPAGTVDAVVAGHTHAIAHHYIGGVPVVQGEKFGAYYNLIHLKVDTETGRVIAEETAIEGPVNVCPKVFANQGNCNGKQKAPANGRGELIAPTFHGKTLAPDASVTSTLAELDKRLAPVRDVVVGHASAKCTHEREAEGAVGNLVTDAMKQSIGADFAIINRGGIRTDIESGPITYGAIYKVFPFDNFLSRLRVTAAELRKIVRVAESGKRGVFPVSGLKVELITKLADAPREDLNGDGKVEDWEVNRVLNLTLADGTEIADTVKDADGKESPAYYTIALPDFMVTGGDDMGWAMSLVPADRTELVAGPFIRDLLITYLGAQSPINTPEKPLINPALPRIILK